MKRFDTILKDTRLQVIKPEPYEDVLLKGYLNLRCGKQRTFSVVMSVCLEERLGGVELVSVKLNNDANKTPTWEEMCEVKEIFWKPEEEVHQIHPPESSTSTTSEAWITSFTSGGQRKDGRGNRKK